jgi:hypothetical protein
LVRPGAAKVIDANTPAAQDVNQAEEASGSSQPSAEPQPAEPNRSRTPEPNEQPGNNPFDANDTNTAAKSTGDTFNKEFEPIFSEYVDRNGMVNYDRLHRYRLQIRALLARLAILDPQEYKSWTRNEKIAFWINTFNLKMLDIIADNYPIESKRFHRLWWPPNSIRHIPPIGDVGTPKWNGYKFIVMDEEFTLYEIEKRFFRKDFTDPRIFLALSFASLDGPPLQNKPYYGKDLDRQLDEQAKRFLSTPSGIRIDRQKNIVELSTLFEPKWPWYGGEFLAKYGTDRKFKSQPPAIAAVLNFISNYLDKRDVVYLETGNYSIRFKAYDWRVNEQ